jgi:hypothetical protein
MSYESTEIPSTTEAAAAQAQSRGERAVHSAASEAPNPCANLNKTYHLGPGFDRITPVPYERKRGDPVFRPLHIFTVDPSTPRLDGAVALVDIPYEPLKPGPVGNLFTVDNYDGAQKLHYRRADLDEKSVLVTNGYTPSQSDPRFHQQMVYAVCSNVYATFRKALGRHLTWGPGAAEGKLIIRPHALAEANAYYDETAGELQFGYYVAGENSTDTTLPGGFVFTCLSHDVIAHEITHALLDGLRSDFSQPSGIDVVAFHEAFADLVAIFQRFSYKEVVRNAIQTSRGDIAKAEYLTELAQQFGHTTGKKAALRSAIDLNIETGIPHRLYEESLEPHELGSVLVGAVFEAFTKIYRRKSERYLRLATGGTGVLPDGALSYELQTILADRVAKLASQFLSICIRAIDYCPPIGLTFGDYLRALITADHDLVPDDPWDYRGALTQAFRGRNIYPRGVANISEEALLWRPTRKPLPPVQGLDFANLRFRGDPGCAADPNELRRQGCILGDFVARPEHLEEFGLVANGDPRLDGQTVSAPTVKSIRSSRRVGPDGQIVFDIVAEVTQLCTVTGSSDRFEYHGGSTIILGPLGEIRYVILKNVVGTNRLERRREFLESAVGKKYWQRVDRWYRPKKRLFKLLHGSDSSASDL